jgi:DNA repair exonuclease SbcCD ATPase subunit
MHLTTIQDKMAKKATELAAMRLTYQTLHTDLDETKKHLEVISEAQEITQNVAQYIQQQAHDRIAGVVSRCLSAIFDEPYVFYIHFERKRNRTEARLIFERNGQEVDPMTASGGGVVDVASFALRLSCLLLNKPPLRRVLIMDEPFKFVSEEYRERVQILLETLSEEMQIQFIMVTHIDELKVGKVVKI